MGVEIGADENAVDSLVVDGVLNVVDAGWLKAWMC